MTRALEPLPKSSAPELSESLIPGLNLLQPIAFDPPFGIFAVRINIHNGYKVRVFRICVYLVTWNNKNIFLDTALIWSRIEEQATTTNYSKG